MEGAEKIVSECNALDVVDSARDWQEAFYPNLGLGIFK